jgi:hypothetical protein
VIESVSPEDYSETSRWLTIDLAIKFIEELRIFRTVNIKEIAFAEHVIPGGEALDRLIRYETNIDRDITRALKRPEQLQRCRKGEPGLPPVSVRLTR